MTDAVCAAWVHGGDVTYSFFGSFVELVAWDVAHDRRVMRGGWIATRCDGYNLVEARNRTAAEFVASGTDWLWWVDTDMGFAADTVDRLCDAAHPADRPIVGALCFTWRDVRSDGMNGARCVAVPTIYNRDGDGMLRPHLGYEPLLPNTCDATGSACILIHRSVFEKIGSDGWYDRLHNPASGELLSEDLSFCARARDAGIPIVVHAGIPTTHAKTIWVGEADYLGGAPSEGVA